MAIKRIQTTFTFKSKDNAEKFSGWLRRNGYDRDYGCPMFIDLRQVSVNEWCVEYSYQSTSDIARGVATGIDL